jgi:hypothetical protein
VGIISIFETNVEKQRINVNSDSVVIEGNKVVITPAEFTLGKLEYVRFPKGTFLDLDNNEHKGILSNTEWNFTITTSTNIENISANNPVIVYPNPSNGLVHVQTLANVPVKAIRIYNYLGGLVFEQNIFENTCCDIDLKQLPAGLYNFVIEIENQQIIKHILIN